MRLWLAILLLLVAACAREDGRAHAPERPANVGLRYLRGQDNPGFAKAIEPRAITFPADHGSHPDFRTEWWYFTGNLESADGKAFGFELTFFRVGLRPRGTEAGRGSAWAADQVWMAHLAVTDAGGQRFIARERLAREALGLAGAEPAGERVWVKSWSAARSNEGVHERWHLSARDGDMSVDLQLAAEDAPVLNGEAGLDRKGAEPGNASYYYSLPRLETTGTLAIDGREIAVRGNTWMDREWSTSALADDVVGWDWFGLRFSDGGSLMFYRLRRRDGTADSFSGGTRVDARGNSMRLGRDDVALTPIDFWTSSVSGTRYPVAWRLASAEAGLSLELRAYIPDQELNLSVRYWEGAVRGTGTVSGGERITAEGYLELAGY